MKFTPVIRLSHKCSLRRPLIMHIAFPKSFFTGVHIPKDNSIVKAPYPSKTQMVRKEE
jgi:hypothetical protein